MQGPLICLASAGGGRPTACLSISRKLCSTHIGGARCCQTCRRHASRGLFAAIGASGKAARQSRYDDEEPEDGDREKEEKGKKPAKKKGVQRPPKARPATKAKKRPREGQQQDGPTDGKKQQPAKQQQQQLSKPQKAPKEPSKAQKGAKAKDDKSSKARYEIIESEGSRWTKKQREAIKRITGEAVEEAEEDRLTELAHRPFYTYEGEKVRVPSGRVLHQMNCCLVSCGSALAEGSCACHISVAKYCKSAAAASSTLGRQTARLLLHTVHAAQSQAAAARHHAQRCFSCRMPLPFCSASIHTAHTCTVRSGSSPQVLKR